MTVTFFWDITPCSPVKMYRLPPKTSKLFGVTPEEHSYQSASTLQTQSVSAGLGTQAVFISKITPITLIHWEQNLRILLLKQWYT
jgi:hypothetical protein